MTGSVAETLEVCPVATDDLSAALEEIRERQHLIATPSSWTSGEFLGTVFEARRTLVTKDVPLLLAVAEIALAPHKRSLNPAWGQGSGNCHGKHFCIGCSIDNIYRAWPCQPYQDITRALLGEAPDAKT